MNGTMYLMRRASDARISAAARDYTIAAEAERKAAQSKVVENPPSKAYKPAHGGYPGSVK